MLVTVTGYSQLYYTGIGVRVGKFNTGASYKHFFNTDNATGVQMEAFYSHIESGGYGVKILGLKQIPFKLPIVQLPLDFIVAGGIHASYFPRRNDNGYYKIVDGEAQYYDSSVLSLGLDGSIQIEYKIPWKIAPFSLTIDCTPFYEVVNRGPEWIDFGVSVRYVFR